VRVLVTGRHGQVAQSLLERAAGRPGLELIAAGRPETDLGVPGSLAEAVIALRPAVVINAAAYTAVDRAEDEPDGAFRINAVAAGEAAAAAREVGARIIQLSTDYVFDGQAGGAQGELAATNPLSVYGRSKLAGEQQVRAASPEHAIIRTAWLYSPFGRNFVRTMVEAARTQDVLSVVDDQFGSPTSALDLAEGLLVMIDRWDRGDPAGVGGTYHLAGSGTASWFELAAQVMETCQAIGLPSAEVRPIKSRDWPTKATRPRNSVLDSGRFASELGFVLPDWRESVETVVRRLQHDQAGPPT
jgi:dTDP-4-dehydrorhamnose reductase